MYMNAFIWYILNLHSSTLHFLFKKENILEERGKKNIGFCL